VLLLLNRAFYSLQQVWLPTWIAAGNLVLNTALLALLYDVAGVWGIALATSIANLVTAVVQWQLLRGRVGDIELRETLQSLALILVASALLAGVALVVWTLLDAALGDGLLAQAVAVGLAVAGGAGAYLAASRLLRIPEAALVMGLVRRRVQSGRAGTL
jgi:peptidoglycan biosynthesis protein MviN/MurJ (putative lipid II flippase)